MPRASSKTTPTPIHFTAPGQLAQSGLTATQRAWATANLFDGQRGRLLALPDTDGARAGFVFGIGDETSRPPLLAGQAAAALPAGTYALAGAVGDPTRAALGFALGAYRFTRYSAPDAEIADGVELVWPEGADSAEVGRLTDAAFLARDLINTPANYLGPDAFEATVRAFAKSRKMSCGVIAGDALLAEGFPMIHAVGRASAEAPRLIDLGWGRKSDPKLTLVGKGVTFDTGGLNIKPGSSMALMKKDMGGAANVLGLASAIVAAGLKVRLRVLVPIVENAIAGAAYRPGDVLPSRAGLNVEIGNTDAEGRLILADALALADEDDPDLIVDMATLTGAARVALGPELPPIYGTDDALVAKLQAAGQSWGDPLWPMPLWQPYADKLRSRIGDINHITPGFAFAGSITAALFLSRFVSPDRNWLHLDIFGWAPDARPGQPVGGADQGTRAAYFALRQRYGTRT